jgi:hypothetical protein
MLKYKCHNIRIIPYLIWFFSILCFSCDKDSPTSHNSIPSTNPFANIENLSVTDLLGFSLAADCTDYLKMYPIPNAVALAEEYRASGMPSFLMNSPYPTRDENNVPLVHYSFGIFRNPVTTCHTAFGYYRYYQETKLESDKQSFLNNIEWLCNSCDKDYYLRYTFPGDHVPGQIIQTGWVSAMAQGEALEAMCIAYNLTGNKKYLDTATGLFRSLYINTDDTWTFMIDQKGYYWLEEYPNEDFCHVLNGFMFGLWGLWDYYVITGDEFALNLFQAGIKTILDNISFWNVEGQNMSMYCRHQIAGDAYHSIHITELQKYADFFGIPEFLDAIETLRH